MTKQKKKPKTGDVVGWVIVSKYGSVVDEVDSRQYARTVVKDHQRHGASGPYRIAKLVLTK